MQAKFAGPERKYDGFRQSCLRLRSALLSWRADMDSDYPAGNLISVISGLKRARANLKSLKNDNVVAFARVIEENRQNGATLIEKLETAINDAPDLATAQANLAALFDYDLDQQFTQLKVKIKTAIVAARSLIQLNPNGSAVIMTVSDSGQNPDPQENEDTVVPIMIPVADLEPLRVAIDDLIADIKINGG